MIQSAIGHLQFNVHPQNLGFYKDLFTFAGWGVLYDHPAMLAVGCSTGASLWFATAPNEAKNDYDGAGMNHFALSVNNQQDVDEMVAYMQEHGIQPLFGTPCHRPEFSAGTDQTYYQVMFESPDHLLFEVVYIGVRA